MPQNAILLFLLLIGIKHFIIDFPLQGPYQWKNKGTYGHLGGVLHAFLHLTGTFLVVWYFTSFQMALGLAFLDGIIHYHIDWLKMSLNSRLGWTPNDPQFWWLLGLDQLAHYLTYVLIIYFILNF